MESGFTSIYGVTKLVWYQDFKDVRDAIALEKRIKHWHRAWKLQLIDSFNHDWRDLAEPDAGVEEKRLDPGSSPG